MQIPILINEMSKEDTEVSKVSKQIKTSFESVNT